MQASLVAIAGPNGGEVVRLGKQLSIGRSRASTVPAHVRKSFDV